MGWKENTNYMYFKDMKYGSVIIRFTNPTLCMHSSCFTECLTTYVDLYVKACIGVLYRLFDSHLAVSGLAGVLHEVHKYTP